MVMAVRHGVPMREVARKFQVALGTVQLWVRRAGDKRLDRVDFADKPCSPGVPANRTSRELEDLVLTIRRELKELSDLGEFGTEAIYRELVVRGVKKPPVVRTIGRILERRGALDGHKRVRRLPPPRGWHLPEVAERRVELDSFDVVEGLVIKGGIEVEVLNATSLHGGLVASFPMPSITAKVVVEALISHWSEVGLPAYAQFDNDTVFQGPHQHPDVVGRVMRLCLSLGVTPVFAPPREMGFQALVENFNGRWQTKVWNRFHHDSLDALREKSARYIKAARDRSTTRIETAPKRRPFPKRWRLDLQRHPTGQIVFLRRTSDTGRAAVLGHTFKIDSTWLHRLVRAEVDLNVHRIRFYALRRREPAWQPLLCEVPYILPRRRFNE